MTLLLLALLTTSSTIQGFTPHTIPLKSFTILKSNRLTVSNDNSFIRLSSTINDGENSPLWWVSSSESQADSNIRRTRKEREERTRLRFKYGNDLAILRSNIQVLQEKLSHAKALNDSDRIVEIQSAIKKFEKKDAERVYAKTLQAIKRVENDSSIIYKEGILSKLNEEAESVRECIPRFNLEGLWVGNYGDGGYEMINVTYVGNEIIATKVTGDKNVPRGEISFRADLSPTFSSGSTDTSVLEPIKLSEPAASKYGVDKLIRFPGKGQVSSGGFVGNSWVDGQFIMFDVNFSFVWVPTRHHVFFGRPSPDVVLRMLRDIYSDEDRLDNVRNHLTRCYEKESFPEVSLEDEEDEEQPFRRIKRHCDLSLNDEQSDCEEGKFSFRQIKRWKNYLDGIMKED